MKKLIIFSLFCIGLMSCSRKVSRDYRFEDNGLIYNYNNNELYTGRIVDTADVVVQYDVVKGVKNGRFVTYYSNGNIEKTGWIESNSNVGEWKYFYPDGTLESSGHFNKDNPHGLWQYFYRNGSLKESGIYNNGVQDGEWLFYDDEGKLTKYIYFQDGLIRNTVLNSI